MSFSLRFCAQSLSSLVINLQVKEFSSGLTHAQIIQINQPTWKWRTGFVSGIKLQHRPHFRSPSGIWGGLGLDLGWVHPSYLVFKTYKWIFYILFYSIQYIALNPSTLNFHSISDQVTTFLSFLPSPETLGFVPHTHTCFYPKIFRFFPIKRHTSFDHDGGW